MALKDASREARLQWFARQIIDAAWHGDVDAADVQFWGVSAGLIAERKVTAENRQWVDENVIDFSELAEGDTFFEFSPDLEVSESVTNSGDAKGE